MDVNKDLVGIKLVDKSIDLEGQDIVGKVALAHVGKLGKLKLTLEGSFELMPLANKAIDSSVDFIEKKIPGDQTFMAEGFKITLKNGLKTLLDKVKL